MVAQTLCERCVQWVAMRGTALCLDCGGLICPACQPTHTAHRVGNDTWLTCQPHTTEEDVRRLVDPDYSPP